MKKFTSNSAVRLAFVGCGEIAPIHVDAIQTVNQKLGWERLQIVAAVDNEVKKAEELFAGFPSPPHYFEDFDNCLETTDFDVAVLLLPHDIHESMVNKSLHHRKDVFLEKPFANTSQECLRMIKSYENSDNIIFVNEQSELWPEVVKAQSVMSDIGDFVTAKAFYHESLVVDGANPFPTQYDGSGWRSDVKRAGGGIMMDGALHWIRPLRRLFGEVTQVVHHQCAALKSMQGESVGHSMLEFESGKVATLDCIVGPPMGRHPFFTIIGTDGEIQIAGEFEGGMTLRDKDNNLIDLGKQGGYFGAFAQNWECFLDCLEKNDTRDNMHSALQDIRIVEAMYRSHQNRTWERVENDFSCC